MEKYWGGLCPEMYRRTNYIDRDCKIYLNSWETAQIHSNSKKRFQIFSSIYRHTLNLILIEVMEKVINSQYMENYKLFKGKLHTFRHNRSTADSFLVLQHEKSPVVALRLLQFYKSFVYVWMNMPLSLFAIHLRQTRAQTSYVVLLLISNPSNPCNQTCNNLPLSHPRGVSIYASALVVLFHLTKRYCSCSVNWSSLNGSIFQFYGK